MERPTKADLLGMPQGTAAGRLRKHIMFDMAKRLGLDECFRCQKKIESVDELSIDHKLPWQGSDSPRKAFFDLNNIAFSHHSCNCAAAHRPNKIYESARERDRVQSMRHRGRNGWKETVARRREKRRLARLARVRGFEPRSSVLETEVLPLNYTPMVLADGIGPSHAASTAPCSPIELSQPLKGCE